jgi:hypothetical protein
MGAAFWTLLGWVGFNLALIAIGLIPKRFWGSHRQAAPGASASPAPAA